MVSGVTVYGGVWCCNGGQKCGVETQIVSVAVRPHGHTVHTGTLSEGPFPPNYKFRQFVPMPCQILLTSDHRTQCTINLLNQNFHPTH